MSGAVPENVTGPFVVLAIFTAQPGKGDELAAKLSEIRAHAESDKELDTLTFRPCRGYKGNTDSFMIFEKYMSREAFALHQASPVTAAFIKSGIATLDKLEYFEELSAMET
ncbi:hypothetical protein FRB94_004762 [Tulasnella sp. JGI-2019a]|nr:hypothetical protein FRB93_004850 [Tulasnella sp. JGI-2019a]KAG9001447.1 hypothetical protein FRB94_004762 [Tulasnella sp. JGI-2019a]KAG9031595.1 hypothetical protein FRB95_002524 [Tulasnella sp. JGI-2019a]